MERIAVVLEHAMEKVRKLIDHFVTAHTLS